jgi:hypothetical protein
MEYWDEHMKRWQFVYALRNTTTMTADCVFQLEAIVPISLIFV